MPKELEIVDGPSFKNFMFMSAVLLGESWTLRFTVDKEIEDHSTANREKKNQFSVNITQIGHLPKKDVDTDEYTFIAEREGKSKYSKLGKPTPPTCTCEHYYYVGQYNTRTRKGQCVEYREHEFFSSQVMRKMYKK